MNAPLKVVPPKPVTVAGDLSKLPDVFAPYLSQKIWVCWRWIWNPKKDDWDKPPVDPRGFNASSTNAARWFSYQDVLAAALAGTVDGIGISLYGLTNSEIVLDLDDCRDPATGTIEPWAQEIVDHAASYAEVTPSGTGLRVIGRGDVGRQHHRFNDVDGRGGGLEVYTAGEGRYVTVSGAELPGCWPHISDITGLTQRLLDGKGKLHPEQSSLEASDQPKAFAPAPAYAPKPGSIGSLLGFRFPQEDLLQLIRIGVKEPGRSEQFHHAVGLAKRLGWTQGQLEQAMRGNPGGIACKYLSPRDRLAEEIARCWAKVDGPSDYDRLLHESCSANDSTPTASKKPLWDPWRETAAPAFPLDVFPGDIANYVEARATETGACASAIAMSCLAVASGAISHEARLYLKPGQNFAVSPRLWVLLVGDPSAKKSPAMDGAVKPLIAAQKVMHAAAMEAWRAEQQRDEEKDSSKKKKSGPDLKHFVIHDTTPEMLADVLSRQDRGTLVLADELAGWLGALDRYGSGKGASSGRAIWLQAYNGGPFTLLRVSRETLPVNNLSASILGGIQPERLRDMGGLTSDGLLQRFLPVMMAKPQLDRDGFSSEAFHAWDQRVRSLLDYSRFATDLSDEAREERRRISQLLFDLGQSDSEGAGWQGFVGKLLGVWGSLALILHLLWGYRAADPVAIETARRASQLVEGFVLPHGLAFYRSLVGNAQADSRAIAGFLAGWEQPGIAVRDFVRGPRCCRGLPPEEIVAKLAPFETGGWIEPEKPGPWNRKWAITPKLAERFSMELARHKAAVAMVQAKITGGRDDED